MFFLYLWCGVSSVLKTNNPPIPIIVNITLNFCGKREVARGLILKLKCFSVSLKNKCSFSAAGLGAKPHIAHAKIAPTFHFT